MRRYCRLLLSASYEMPDIEPTKIITARMMPAPTINPMMTMYSLNASIALRQLPEPAQTVSGMIENITSITPTVLKKVSMS